MFEIHYYERPNGRQPVADWLDTLALPNRTVIDAKIDTLREKGLELLATNMMQRVEGEDADFYELVGRQCRIALYYDRHSNVFVLLHGFLKKRPREKREIARARALLQEYLSTRRTTNEQRIWRRP